MKIKKYQYHYTTLSIGIGGNQGFYYRSKYRVSPILYRRYFFSIDEGIANAFEKSIGRGIANIIWPKKSILFTDTFFLYYIGFNGLPPFATVERLFTLGGNIFAQLLTRLSSRHFEIVMLFHASIW